MLYLINKVKSRYPNATAVKNYEHGGLTGDYSIAIWTEPQGPRGLIGYGLTEEIAWEDAVQTIEYQEGRKLPLE